MQPEKTILLAEDDAKVRNAAVAILEFGGYRVVTATNGQEAVALYSGHHIDLVLMDVIMPVMNGVEAGRLIREYDPDARLVFTSGYSANILQAEGFPAGEVRLLQKPVAPDSLLRAVREALEIVGHD